MVVQRLILAVLLIAAAYIVYSTFQPGGEGYTVPAAAPLMFAPPPRGPMEATVASGPNPPSVAGPRAAPAIIEARDPYQETVERADAPEQLTRPENYYGPAIVPESGAAASMLAVESGIASMRSSPGPRNATLFTPETVANGAAMEDSWAMTNPGSPQASNDITAAEPVHGISYSLF
jgi:hypothetical protein